MHTRVIGLDPQLERDVIAAMASALARRVVSSPEFWRAIRIEQHARFDVGHELVLPERERSDHR